jgi:ABC-type multidrug transport system ATPase subunit
VFVLLLTIVISFAATILISSSIVLPLPSFADRIYAIHQGTTLALGCDLSNGDDFIATTKVFKYDQPNNLIFNCERSGGHVDLKKGESIALWCLHDNPLTIAKHKKMNLGELFYVICK